MDILYIKDIKRCSIAKWKDLGLSKNGHRPFFISESDGFFEFGDKSFPIFFCSQSHVRMASHKMGRFIFWPNHYWCFKTFMFHHFSPFLTVQKKRLNPYWFSNKRLCFKRELVTSYINLKIGLKYLERLKKKRINTWFNMVQKSLFVERTMPWF